MTTAVEWVVAPGSVGYAEAEAAMRERVAGIRAGGAGERVWLVEHPPMYTAGISARPEELVDPGRFPTFKTGRGGHWTYHGPGQRVGYVMLDLKRPGRQAKGPDVRAYVRSLEDWLIATLRRFNVKGERRAGRVVNHLQQICGWKPYRMLTPTGMSEADPLASNDTPEGKAQNRRVAVNVLVSKGLDGL